jgi:putative aldouronate transport system permease protein
MQAELILDSKLKRKKKRKKTLKKITANWQVYLMVLPALVVLIWFRYIPIYGLQIAFKDFSLLKGITGSEWVGMKHFVDLFSTNKFLQVLRNTLLINVYRIVFTWAWPIILAIMVNECRNLAYKRIAQSISYLPHFLSWVIISAIFMNLLSLDTGIVNILISMFGGRQIIFLSDPRFFRSILVITEAWKNTGWSSIVYLSAITAIDTDLYQAAAIDGAGKLRRIWHITLPGIKSTMVFILILRVGSALTNDLEQVLMFYNPMVYETGDVLGTYLYRIGIGQMKYSFTTAAGLFTSIISTILMVSANYFAYKIGERGMW